MAKIVFNAGVAIGDPLSPAPTTTTITVVNAETGINAPIWSDRAGASTLANPFNIVNTGVIKFYTNAGRFNITATSGASSISWTDAIQIDPDATDFTSITETTTARTLSLGDHEKFIDCTNAAGCSITVPPQSSVAWQPDTVIVGTGHLGGCIFNAGSGVLIAKPDDKIFACEKGARWELRRKSDNSWLLSSGGLIDVISTSTTLSRRALSAIDNAGAVLIVGDSIANGATATTYNRGFSYRFTKAILNHVAGTSAADAGYCYETIMRMASAVTTGGILHNGTLITDTGVGAVDSRLRLTDGQYIEITGREMSQFDVFYDGSSSSGSLVFTLNTATFATKALTGTGVRTTFPTQPFTLGGQIHADDKVRITASGGTAFITGLITLRSSSKSPTVTVAARGSWGFDEFADTVRADEVAATVNYFRNTAEKTLFICLGTNNIYNPAIAKTPAAYIAALNALIVVYKARMSNLTVVIQVPPKANEAIFPPLSGYTYQQYVDAIVSYGITNNYQTLRLDRVGLDSSFLTDGVHPADAGHSIIASELCKLVGISYNCGELFTDKRQSSYRRERVVYNDTWTDFSSTPAFGLNVAKIGPMIHLAGIAIPVGSTDPIVGSVPVGFAPIGYDAFLVCNTDSAPAHVKILQNGDIVITSPVSVLSFISFAGLSYIRDINN